MIPKVFGLLQLTRINDTDQFAKKIVTKARGKSGLQELLKRSVSANANIKYEIIDVYTRKILTKSDIDKALKQGA
jgi:hypothetical protein